MKTQDLNLMPTIQLWRLANENPDDYELQKAVQERDQFHHSMRRQNEKDRAAAAEKRKWEAEYGRYRL